MIYPSKPYNDLIRSKEALKYASYILEGQDLDFLSTMAAEICNTESALITLIGNEKQYIQSSYGMQLEVREFPREFTFCAHTINNKDQVTVVPDARMDERFQNNPFVTGENPVIFYSGYPLVNNEGYALGTICAIDSNPSYLNEVQKNKLGLLARQVMSLLELRKTSDNLKATNDELLKLNNRFKYITSSSNTATFEFDLKNSFLIFNEEWWKITGYTEDDYNLDFWESKVHPDDISNLKSKITENSKSKDLFKHQFRLKNKQDNYIWISIRAQFHSDRNSSPHIYGMIRETTKQKNREKEILYKQALLEALYELSPIGIALNDFKTGAFLEVNDKLLEPSGYTKEEFLKLNYSDVTPTHYENQEAQQIEILSSTGTYGPYEKEYIRKNGETYPVRLSGIITKDTNGNLKIWSFIEDISEEKKEKREKSKQLEKIQSLLKLKDDQNERLKNFAHIVSHNLRSHSGAIEMLIHLIQEEDKSLSNQETFSYLVQASSNLETTIQDLNEIVKVNLLGNDDFASNDIYPLIKKNVESVYPLANESNVNINIDVKPETYVFGLKSYLESVFLNFITNAIKYCSTHRNSYLNISAKKKKDYTIIEFEDNGLGIDMESYSERLFKMYQTFHNNENAKGIGLFITKNQIEIMNGTIEVRSEVNKGTRFIITLPNRDLNQICLKSDQ